MDEVSNPANTNISFRELTTNPQKEWVDISIRMMIDNFENTGVSKDMITRQILEAWKSMILEYRLVDHAEKNISLAQMDDAMAFCKKRSDSVTACFKRD